MHAPQWKQPRSEREAVAQIVSHLQGGGKEQCVVTLANALLAEEVTSVVVSLEPPGNLREQLHPDVHFYTLGKAPGNDVTIPFRLFRILRREQVTTVHCHNWGTLVESVVAAKLRRRCGVVYTQHGLDYESGARPEQAGRWRRRIVKRVAFSAVDRVVAVSHEVRDLLISGWQVPPGKVEVIHNGVPEISSRLTADERAGLRSALGLGEQDFVVGSVGGFRPVKNFPVLIEAVGLLRGRVPGVKLLLVGDGSGRAAVERSVARHGLNEVVTLPGRRGDVPQLLQVMDVFALPSLSEGISLSILEAMMAGIPVVATRVGGNPEIVDHGVTGLLVDVSAAAIAEAVLSLAINPAARRSLGLRAQQRAEAMFTVRRMAHDYRRVYRHARRRAGTAPTE